MATQTIGTGGDQPNWATWEATLGTLSANETGAQLNEELTITSTILIDGITLSGNTLTMTAGTGNSFVDNMDPTSDAVTYDATKGAAIKATAFMNGLIDTTVGMTISRLQGSFSNGAYDKELITVRNGAACTVDQMIILAVANTTGNGRLLKMDAAGTTTVQRSLFIGQGNYSGFIATGVTLLNCGFINTAGGSGKTGFAQYSGNPTIKNCYALGFATASSGTANAASANNACTNASFGGTNYNGGTPQTSVVAADVLESFTGAADARLKSGSVLIGAGTASGAPATDMFGNSWNGGTPDIGPIRAATGGGGGGGYIHRRQLNGGARDLTGGV